MLKKVICFLLTLMIVLSMATVSFAVDFTDFYFEDTAIETFEETDEEVEGELGGIICVADQKNTTGLSIFDEDSAYFTFNEYWKTNGSKDLIGYNKIVEENGNHYAVIDYNTYFLLNLFSQGESYIDLTGVKVDMKATKVTGYTGICMRSRAYGCLDQHGASEDGIKYPHEAGIGFTLDPTNKQVILIYVYTGSEVAISFPVDTGVDLSADFHNYAIYDYYDGRFVFQFDHKTIATAVVTKQNEDYNDKNCDCVIKDADGNVKIDIKYALVDMAPTEIEFSTCGEGMEIAIDNFGLFDVEEVIEGTPAPKTATPEVTNTPSVTDEPSATEVPATEVPATEVPATEAPKSSGGCGGVISGSVILVAITGGALLFYKKRKTSFAK